MFKDKFIDELTVRVASLVAGKNKFFSKSIESNTVSEFFVSTSIELPEIDGEGEYIVTAHTQIGPIDTAFLIYQWKGAEYPTIIYHHGNNEQPFNFGRFSKNTFKNIFVDTNKTVDCNLIVLRAPFHNSSMKEYLEKISELSNFVAMLAVSTIVVDKLIESLKNSGHNENKVIVSGISLGGWVTNLHRAYFNTADAYIPMLAGAALGDIFITSIYKKMAASNVMENEKSEYIRRILNFEEDFMKVKDENVFPLLARYDQIIKYDRQKVCYGDKTISILEKGHVTAAIDSEELWNHVFRNSTHTRN